MNGLIAWFARNGVAANLLMLAIMVAGIYTLATNKIPVEVFPEFPPDELNINITYRGATPEEVEESVVKRVEEAIYEVEGIEKIISYASEGSARINVEIDEDYNQREVLDDVKNAVDGISTFPDDVEQPRISLPQGWRSVISVVLFGDLAEDELRKLGERVRDEMANLPDVTSVELQGVRPYEISIEVEERTLQQYGLTFDQITQALRSSSLDVSAGTLKTEAGEIALRTKGRAYTGEDFSSIVILSRADGTRITLGDIATVNDGFDENPFIARYNGKRCVVLMVSREGDQNAIKIAEQVKDYMEEAQHRLPPGVGISYWSDMSRIVKGRLDMLYDSALQSVFLVFLVLALFLRPSLAIWVVVGIPVCFLGAIALMPFLGVTINVISLFGFILVLGVVVDDAIVTGENIYTLQRGGMPIEKASVVGTQEVAMPVIFGVMTTVLAFVPLLYGTGFQGRANSHIALIVIPVLIFSLIESKLILPSHLNHSMRTGIKSVAGVFIPDSWVRRCSRGYGFFSRFQEWIARRLEIFVAKVYQPALGWSLRNRYITLAIFIGLFMVLAGLFMGGRIARVPFPRVESERATSSLSMQEGTPFEVTEKHIARMEEAAREMQKEYVGPDGVSIIENIMSSVGGQGVSSSRGGGGGGETHLGEVSFYITPPEEREFKIGTREIVAKWRERIGPIVGAKTLLFRAEIGRGGDPIDLQLTGPDINDLTEVASVVRDQLGTYEELFDISDSLDETNDEIRLEIKPEAEQFNLTQQSLALQVRQAFFGEEIQRVQRGRDEIRVMLRYPEERRQTIASLEAMRIRTPDGGEVPFTTVARAEIGRSFPRIQRIDRKRAVNITADANKEEANLPLIKASIQETLDDLVVQYPGMNYSFEGEAREERENQAAMWSGALLILFGIYVMLAIPFRSYAQPLIVMLVIPFGLIGGVVGHVIEGLPLSILSFFGMLALSGVVVNDSLVLVDYINRKTREGMTLFDAVHTAGGARFRAIMLTSFTTFAGLYPLINLESTQAQFLIPMAVSLGYGILFATVITLFLVPITYLVFEDIKWVFGVRKETPAEESEGSAQPATS